MDKALWKKIASFWTRSGPAEEKEEIVHAAERSVRRAVSRRQKERSLIDLLMDSLDEEDDDGY